MRPLDPQLLRRSGNIRSAIAVTVLTGIVAAVATVAQAVTAAHVVTRAFLHHEPISALTPWVAAFAGAWAVRSLANTVQDVWARRAGLQAVAELRGQLVDAVGCTSADQPGALALLGRGIDALEVYVARYLPQLVLAVVVPIGLGAWVLAHDVWSAVVLLVTIPLIPLFMALIGWFTDAAVTRQWEAVARITTVIDDLFAGLPDLVVFGRATAQAALIRKLGANATTATMRVLRISFLSSFALELIATISVAIVALGIGLRLTNGEIDLETGLMILILAPDVYLPIRQVGTQFHAAVEGMEAWAVAQPLLEHTTRSASTTKPSVGHVQLDGVAVGYEGPLHAPVHAVCRPGSLTAITGRSGAGKSTLLRAIAGLTAPISGAVFVDDTDVRALDEQSWFAALAYVPQDPWLGHGTVAEALTRGRAASEPDCVAALARVGLPAELLAARIDDLGSGVSVGQRRRIALARALLRNAAVVLLDEPTAAVDAESEDAVLSAIDDLRRAGAVVIAVAHRPALVERADQVLHLERVS